MSTTRSRRPDWLVEAPYDEVDHGAVKSGKEAQVNLVERIGVDGRSCLIARKRYLPRTVTYKGELEAMGVQRAARFTHDVQYREGRQFRKSRDRRAVERMSTYGKHLLQDRWIGTEHDVMKTLWARGVAVPYPIAYTDGVFDLEYVGDWERAAPQLRAARLSASSSAAPSTNCSSDCEASRRPGTPMATSACTTCSGGRAGSSSLTFLKPWTSRRTWQASTSCIVTSRTSATGSRHMASTSTPTRCLPTCWTRAELVRVRHGAMALGRTRSGRLEAPVDREYGERDCTLLDLAGTAGK